MAPSDALMRPPKIDLKDTNVALIGSDLDHQVKHASAATEPAWNNGAVGKKAGVFAWRVEDFALVAVPPAQLGTFFDGDSYVVLHSVQPPKSAASSSGADPDAATKLRHDVFFWLGAHTSQDEAGVAAYKAVELDEFLDGRATQHREVQEAMSAAFLALFPRLTLRRGGVASGFRHVEAGEAEAGKHIRMLLRVFKGEKHGSVVVHEVEPSWRSLDDEDVFVLDVGDKIWVWQGRGASPMEKARAAQVVADLTLAKHIDVEVVSQTEGRSRRVVDLLGGGDEAQSVDAFKSSRPSVSAHPAAASTARPRRLFKLTDASGKPSFELVKEGGAITSADLEGNDIFVLDDAGREIWVWEGQKASRAEKAQWLRVTQAYIAQLQSQYDDAHLTPVAKVMQGHESPAFMKAIAVH